MQQGGQQSGLCAKTVSISMGKNECVHVRVTQVTQSQNVWKQLNQVQDSMCAQQTQTRMAQVQVSMVQHGRVMERLHGRANMNA